MFKLGELKRTFVKNNRKRRNLNAYFNNFATEGRLSLQALQRIVGEYGYDISAEEARLVARLSGSQDDFLTQEQFVELMTKDNVLFGTLKLDGAFGKPKVHF